MHPYSPLTNLSTGRNSKHTCTTRCTRRESPHPRCPPHTLGVSLSPASRFSRYNVNVGSGNRGGVGCSRFTSSSLAAGAALRVLVCRLLDLLRVSRGISKHHDVPVGQLSRPAVLRGPASVAVTLPNHADLCCHCRPVILVKIVFIAASTSRPLHYPSCFGPS